MAAMGISFKDTTADDRLGTLYLNELNNIKSCFETLNGINTDDLVMMNDEQAELQDFLLQVKANEVPLFAGIKQGSGKNENNVLVITMLKLR